MQNTAMHNALRELKKYKNKGSSYGLSFLYTKQERKKEWNHKK